MAARELPARPSHEHLKKQAKARLRELRRTHPETTLAEAQLSVAREYGLPSWRALVAEVDRRRAAVQAGFFAACAAGDVGAVLARLTSDPDLVDALGEGGATALHVAVQHPPVVRLLLEHGADPNVREQGDHALPIHLAAGSAPLDSVRALLDAGSDVRGEGDAHGLDVIGWAACFAEPRRDVIALLLARGARHHVFSAVAVGDRQALRELAAGDPEALHRRLSPLEQRQTALHYCVAPPDGLVGGLFRDGSHYATLELLVELGADLEAQDAQGRTPLAVAMVHGDREAMRILHGAGARAPGPDGSPEPAPAPELRDSVVGLVPMLAVPDVDAAIRWYGAVGFELTGSNGAPGSLDWAEVRMGRARIMFAPSGNAWRPASAGIQLWLYTNRIEDVYAALKRGQFDHSRSVLAGVEPAAPEVRFRADLHTSHYGMREFSIEDPHGIDLTFAQPAG